MRQSNGQIDWNATREHYEALPNSTLHGALLDIQKTLPAADSMDRANGNALQGGYYRDEASVIRQILADRQSQPFNALHR